VTITWRSHRQGTYLIEQSNDLITWDPVFDPDPGNGATTTVTIGGGFPSAFFRVVQH
jgi:cobyrinic acid a,c-diamide synthase